MIRYEQIIGSLEDGSYLTLGSEIKQFLTDKHEFLTKAVKAIPIRMLIDEVDKFNSMLALCKCFIDTPLDKLKLKISLR